MRQRGIQLVLIGLCLIVIVMVVDNMIAPIGEPLNSLLTIGGIVLELVGGYHIMRDR